MTRRCRHPVPGDTGYMSRSRSQKLSKAPHASESASVVQVLFDGDWERTTYNNIHIPFGKTPQQRGRHTATQNCLNFEAIRR